MARSLLEHETIDGAEVSRLLELGASTSRAGEADQDPAVDPEQPQTPAAEADGSSGAGAPETPQLSTYANPANPSE